MPLHTIRALILQTYDTGDTSEVLRVFTPDFGRLSVMAKGLRNPKNRLAGILQPLSTVEIGISLREGADMGTLREASAGRERPTLRADLERLALGALVAEIASESCEVAQGSEGMYALLEQALDALDGDGPASTIAVHHLIRALTLAGYEPHIDGRLLAPWPEGLPRPVLFWLDLAEGRVHADHPQPGGAPRWPFRVSDSAPEVPIPPEAVRALYTNQITETADLAGLPEIPPGHATQFIEAIVRLAQYHLGHPIRSARFWRSMAWPK